MALDLVISFASLLLGQKHAQQLDDLVAREHQPRLSAPASYSASFLRRSANSRLTGKDSGRRGTSRGTFGAASSSRVRGEPQEGVALGLVEDELQAQHDDIVAHARLQIEQRAPQAFIASR